MAPVGPPPRRSSAHGRDAAGRRPRGRCRRAHVIARPVQPGPGQRRGPASTCRPWHDGCDYRPNRIAQALPSGRSQMLALLLPDITNPHNFGLIRGAEAQARAAGYTLILGHTQESPELEPLQRRAAGVRRWTASCSPAAGCRTTTSASWPRVPPSCSSTGEIDRLPQRRDGRGGRRPPDRPAPRRARPPLDRLPGRPAQRLDRCASGGGRCPARRARRASRSPGTAPSPPRSTHGAAAADVGLRHRRHRSRGVQRPARDRRPPAARAAGRARARGGQRRRLRRHLRLRLLQPAAHHRHQHRPSAPGGH